MARDYVCLYHSYLDAIQALGDAERGRLLTAMLEYSLTGTTGHLGGNERFIFPMVKAQIDRDKAKYQETCLKRSESGKLGGRPEKQMKANAFCESKKSQGEGKGKEEIEAPKGAITRATRFTPPTLAEVQSYVAERHSPVDPQEFIDFYAAKGWMVGKTPMKDWKAACRNAEKWDRWARKQRPTNGPTYTGGEAGEMAAYIKALHKGG